MEYSYYDTVKPGPCQPRCTAACGVRTTRRSFPLLTRPLLARRSLLMDVMRLMMMTVMMTKLILTTRVVPVETFSIANPFNPFSTIRPSPSNDTGRGPFRVPVQLPRRDTFPLTFARSAAREGEKLKRNGAPGCWRPTGAASAALVFCRRPGVPGSLR